jgi:hypothetical protein
MRTIRYHRCSTKLCPNHTVYVKKDCIYLHQCGYCLALYEVCDYIFRDPYFGDMTLINDEEDE